MFGKPSATTRRIWTVVATLAVCFALLPMAPALAATTYNVTINDVALNEGTGAGTTSFSFTVSLSTPVAAGATVSLNWATADGSAVAPSDYTAASGALSFTAGQSAKTVTVLVNKDNITEVDQTFSVVLSDAVLTGGGAGDTLAITDATGIGTILNDDALPVANINSPTVLENAGTMTFLVTLDHPNELGVEVDYSTGPGTAVWPSDYLMTAGTLQFAPGETSKTIVVPIVDDTVDEGPIPETFWLYIMAVRRGVAGTNGIGTIIDNDQPVWSVTSPTVKEDLGPMRFWLTIDRTPYAPGLVTVDYTTAIGTASAADFTTLPPVTTCAAVLLPAPPAGPGGYGCWVDITLTNDALVEPAETFSLILFNPISSTIGTATGTGTILDDDSEPSINVSSQSVSEGAGSMDFIVSLSAAYTETITVQYQTINGTATAGSDYTRVPAAGWATLTFLPGETSKTVTVPILEDVLDEANETFQLDLQLPVNAKLGTEPGTGTIIDNDTPAISINSVTGSEGAGTFTFTVSLNAAPVAAPVSVQYQTANGTALAPGDYTAIALTTLNWAIGDGAAKTFTVTINEDALDEFDETFSVILSNAVGGNIATGTGTGTITDNDATPTLSINSPAPVAEATPTAYVTFTITLSAASGKTVTVDYASASGALPWLATSGLDFTGVGGTLTFAPGETTKTVQVAIINDTLHESVFAPENFTVTLSNAVNAGIATAVGTGYITDDDPAPVISANSPSAAEGAGFVTFTVSLDRASFESVSVDYQDFNSGETYPAGYWVDYVTIVGWTTLTFAPGETTKTISYAILEDTLDEQNETFSLYMQNALSPSGVNPTILGGGGYPGTPVGTATILDNDQPVVSISTDTANPAIPASCTPPFPSGINISSEPEGLALGFIVYLDQVPVNGVTVDFRTLPGTATATTDYTPTDITLSFAAGTTTLCQWAPSPAGIPVFNDALDEPNETLIGHLQNAIGATIGAADATGTIEDDDPTQLSISNAAVLEGTGAGTTTLRFTITGTSPLAVADTLPFIVTLGGGVDKAAASDFTLIPASPLALAAGAGPWYLDFTIARDTVDEWDETFTVAFGTDVSANYNYGVSSGTGTILDDDSVTVSIADVSQLEGNIGWSWANMAVTLTGGHSMPITIDITSVAGTATAGIDYLPPTPGSVVFPPSLAASQTLSVSGSAYGSGQILGDTIDEADETFMLNLSANFVNPWVIFTDASGLFTILDDDPDVTPPILHLPANMTVEATSPAGAAVTFVATATDAPHANPPVTCLPASGSTFAFGTTTVNCTTTDASGNTASGSFTITVVDTTPPVITLVGAPHVTVLLYGTYVDDGATAFDNIDGDITAWIVTVNPVDTAMVGDYMVTYDVMDSHGNHAVQVTRMVHVVYACGGHEATIIGTAGDDTLTGTPGDDVFMGLEGADTIYGLGGNDMICGGPGSDMLYGGEGDDTIIANAGADMLYGEAGNDTLYGGVGNDRFFGGAGDDLMMGGTGFDVLDYSGAGAAMTVDLYAGSASGDGADSLLSFERLVGSAFDDTLIGGPADNTIRGGAGNDLIYGGGGNDSLYGDEGDDTIYGQGGDDSLYGGPGEDILIGGQGNDIIDLHPEGFHFAL